MPSSRFGKRLEALEARQGSDVRNVSAEALRHLSDEELDALEEAFEEGIELGLSSVEDLHAVISERSRRALDRLCAVVETVRRGENPPENPRALEALERLERVNEGDEEAKREYARRNGYRIWQYYRREKRN